MNSSTVAALNRINRRFYDQHQQSFSATRSRPWPGWNRAISPFLATSVGEGGAQAAQAILDVGCGNGRFAIFLDSVSCGTYRYLGIDSSPEMLLQADRRLVDLESIEAHFQLCELTRDPGDLDLAGRPFDLVVLFGVLHHIPGLDHRRRLLERLANLLAPSGFLVLSFWQFGNKDRFQGRILDWSDHNRLSSESVDRGQLEPGDFLLAWGDTAAAAGQGGSGPGPRRYCHYANPGEAEELTQSLGLDTVDRFESDGGGGNLNLYFVLQTAK